jgi:predicted nucleic acid-binding protein
MIVLDTNVVSELMRPRPEPAVIAWANAQDARQIYLCATSVAEVLFGIERLPTGRRRNRLAELFAQMLSEDFTDRILAFDQPAATHYAQITASREARGRPIGTADAQIASICRLRGAPFATRNTTDFEHCGVNLVDPWQHRP